ncbi:hypothetical protein A5N83_25560 [Rhodococcus sp. 1139]|nr:hypothetical protein A5N83_25560 [Rhodococcus sp. 1139]
MFIGINPHQSTYWSFLLVSVQVARRSRSRRRGQAVIGSNSAGDRGVAMVESCKPVADLGLKRRKAGKCTGRQT